MKFNIHTPLQKLLLPWLRQRFYYTIQGPFAGQGYSFSSSYLPSLQKIPPKVQDALFLNRYVILYLGVHSSLYATPIRKSGIDLKQLQGSRSKIFYFYADAPNLRRFTQITKRKLCKDWWVLTQSQEPKWSDLQKEGWIASPAAFQGEIPDLKGESLLSYFTDPSFHCGTQETIEFFMNELFRHFFKEAYAFQPRQPSWAKIKAWDTFDLATYFPKKSSASLVMNSFELVPQSQPRLYQSVWPSKEQILWQWNPPPQSQWEVLEHVEESSIRPISKVLWSYIPILLLVPVAILTLPITLILWAISNLILWFLQKLPYTGNDS